MLNALLERDLLPDVIIRRQMRSLLSERLRKHATGLLEARQQRMMDIISRMDESAIAEETAAAQRLLEAMPVEFFRGMLGRQLKFSSGYWRAGVRDLDQAEAEMLDLTCQRAELVDGQHVLELGSGWGSFSLFAAERYPKSRVTAVCLSPHQQHFIEAEAHARGLANLRVIAANLNHFELTEKFDRMVAIELFEHMRNHRRLLGRLAAMLESSGKLFVHMATHREYAYFFHGRDPTDWLIGPHVEGGMMPCANLLFYFQDALQIIHHWRVDGTHYRSTVEAWLQRLDAHRDQLLPLLAAAHGEREAMKWWVNWRLFLLARAEQFGYRDGSEWFISHYLLQGH